MKIKNKPIYDLFMSVGAIVVFNMAIQLLIYPLIADRMGNDAFGVVRSLMAFVSISAGSLGTSANYSRMMTEKKYQPSNSNYVYLLLGGGLISAAIGVVYMFTVGAEAPISIPLYALLILLTAFRYYSDVSFRMKGDFFGYMLFYLIISLGYAAGILAYFASEEWYLAFILGEAAGIVFVMIRGTVYRRALARPDDKLPKVFRSMSFLLSSNLMENLTLNADGLVLMAFCDGEAVATFYTASLLGKVIAMLSAPLNSIIISHIVRGNVKLSKKFWAVAVGAVIALGALTFLGCTLVSPLFIKIFYPRLRESVMPYIVPAILGQIFYFISGILLVVLLKFNGEKKQFFINGTYCLEFFVIVTTLTSFFGLSGFVWGVLIANALRFLGVTALGCAAVAR